MPIQDTCTRGFVDRRTNFIVPKRFEESGVAIGPAIQAGIRFPIESAAIGGEVRYQRAAGELSSDFLGPKVDLAGLNYLLNLSYRF